jgi:hypothetical protein
MRKINGVFGVQALSIWSSGENGHGISMPYGSNRISETHNITSTLSNRWSSGMSARICWCRLLYQLGGASPVACLYMYT